MPLSPFRLDIPATDVLSYVFPEGKEPTNKPLWIDADDTTNSLAPKQLLGLVKRFGLGLDRLGIPKGEAVMMYTRNHIQIPVFYLTVAGTGRIFTGCNPAYGVKETAYQLENTGAKLLLVEPMFVDIVLQAADKAGLPRDRIYLFSDKPCETTQGVKDWHTLLSSEQDAKQWTWHRMGVEESRSSTATLNYSSGTTGLPKGVMISHQNIVANVEQSLYMRNLEQSHESTQATVERWLGFLPLFHAYGQLWSIMAAAKTETPVYFMREFQYDNWLANIEKHRITHIQTAPPVLVMLAKRPETERYDLSSLVNILCGAAPLSKELQNEVSDKLDLKIVQTWGMTEVTCSCLHVPGGLDDRSGSVGCKLTQLPPQLPSFTNLPNPLDIDPNSEIKLIDDDGQEVGPHQRGEIHVRGPNVCLGYWKNEEATRTSFDRDGFLKTGDIAMRDENGWHWIVDRKKELIKVRGFQVAPAELEAVLLENEHVADAGKS